MFVDTSEAALASLAADAEKPLLLADRVPLVESSDGVSKLATVRMVLLPLDWSGGARFAGSDASAEGLLEHRDDGAVLLLSE